MLSLTNFFQQQFDDQTLSDARFVLFAQAHLEALKNNDPKAYFAELIDPTAQVVGDFMAAQTEKDSLKSMTEGATVSVDQLLADFKAKALQREGLIRDTFGTASALYQEFYPHGTNEYTRCTKTNALLLMERMANAYQRNQAQLPPARVEEFTQLYSAFKAARTTQLEKKTNIGKKQETKNAHRAQLEHQMQYNLLTIARHYIGQPELCSVFFNLPLLTPYRSGKATVKNKSIINNTSNS
jgi:hypothetical protein